MAKTNGAAADSTAKPIIVYIATDTIDHDGQRYLSGDPVPLENPDRLLALGVVRAVESATEPSGGEQ